ncbi:MAG TPA: invasin domain 3-containing protein, partial [Acidimicrobiales bacterium]|nr:invasin domain 3-containing protein [Acidimicrobiales bacterium]
MGTRHTGRSLARRYWALALAVLLPGLGAAVIGTSASAAPGVPANVVVTLAPSCIKANHTSTSTATATVTDSTNLPVPGQTVNFATNGDVTFGPVTDHGNGTYTSTITSSLTSDVENITATAGGKTSAAVPLTESLATASSIVFTSLNPASVRAGGTTSSTATATVTDANGKCVGGDTVTFTASPSGPTIGAVTDHGDGTYTASILPSATPGNESITAHDGALNSNSKTLTQFGPTNAVAVALTPSTVTANGTDTSVAKATLTDSGGRAVNDATVVFSTSGDASVGSTTNNHDGTYSATITASTTADTETITALAEGKSGTAMLTEQPGPAASVTVVLSPTSIPADGATHSTATATVKDAHQNPVTTESVTFSRSGDVGIVASGTNHSDGTYTSQITASTTADQETITATTSNNKSGQATLTETAGSTNGLQLTLNPTSIAADGTSHSTATATLTDSNGNGVPGVSVGFGTSGDVTFSPNNATTNASGVATSQITASTTADTETITANGGGKTNTAQLVEYGKANTVTVGLNPTSITADGAAHSTATATLADANGKPVLNETVVFSTNGDVTFGPVTNNNNGTYTSQITASKTADQETITATATNAAKTGTATLTENPGTPIVTVTLAPSTIIADGASQSTATASVKDANGNPYSNETVAFTTSGDVSIGSTVTNHHDGTYSVTITSSTTADQETITATDAAKSKNGTATLTETNGPATSVVLGLSPTTLTADGTSTSAATATVKDANNNPVINETVTITTSGDAKPGAVTNHNDGTYTATITASKTADAETITATATKANKAGTATLTENPGPPVVTVTVNPASIPADGKSQSTATAAVKDANGNPYPNETVTFS